MKTDLLLAVRRACVAATLLFGASAYAQQPGAPVAPTTDTAEAPETAEPDEVSDTAQRAIERNPAIRAAVEMPREEPADYLQSIVWLIDLGQPGLAAPILEELSALQLSDVQRAALVTKFGSAGMLKLARSKELAPAGGEFADAAMAAAAAQAQNPQRLSQLIAQLAGPSSEVRHAARADLVAAGQTGVNATLEAIASEADPQRRGAFVSATARMRPIVVGPLLAMLDTSDPALKNDVSRILRHLGVAQAAPLLPADSATAEQALTGAIANYRQGAVPFAPDGENRVTLWHWDDATKKLTSTHHPADEARTIWMSRLARQLAQLRPDSRAYERQAVVLGLEADGLVALNAKGVGGEARATRWVAAIDPSEFETSLLDAALADALAQNYPRAAVAIIDELGKRRDAAVLFTADGEPSPLAAALVDANRRVRFAAVKAIMAIDPASPYAGSSHFAEAIAYFAGSSGQRRAVVAAPTAARATDLAGALAAEGLEGVATNEGTEAVKLARAISDLEMILVDMDIQSPDVRQVVYELRIFPTTGDVPIALVAADGRLADAQRIAEEHEGVIAVSRPHSPELVSRIVDELGDAAGRGMVTADERAAQSREAMTWLAKLLDEGREFYALRRYEPAIEASLYRAGATEETIAALGRLGTPASQVALADYASQNTLPITSRRAAATAFHNSVKENGVLLTSDAILSQYDRYNLSAKADAETQKVLSVLLDAIEMRRSAGRTP